MTAPKSALTYRVDRDETVEFAAYAFLVVPDDLEDGTVVLVDTGVLSSDSEYMQGRGRTVGPPGGGPEPLLAGLDAAGLEPADIDVVVLTHLHHDHTANVDMFEDAEFVVQRRELAAARDPIPILATPYNDEAVQELLARDPTVVDGDTELRPGLDLLLTPGHTDGMQTLVVETETGPCALIGDLAYNQHNLHPDRETIVDASGEERAVTPTQMSYVPPGTHVDVAACYDSIEAVREYVGPTGRLVSSHDSEAAGEL